MVGEAFVEATKQRGVGCRGYPMLPRRATGSACVAAVGDSIDVKAGDVEGQDLVRENAAPCQSLIFLELVRSPQAVAGGELQIAAHPA